MALGTHSCGPSDWAGILLGPEGIYVPQMHYAHVASKTHWAYGQTCREGKFGEVSPTISLNNLFMCLVENTNFCQLTGKGIREWGPCEFFSRKCGLLRK